jgi:hypothetical protein
MFNFMAHLLSRWLVVVVLAGELVKAAVML